MYVPRHPPLLPLRLFQGDLAQKVSRREVFNYFKVFTYFKVTLFKGFQGFKVSRFKVQSFKVTLFKGLQGFKVQGSKFQGDLAQKVSTRERGAII